LDLLDLDILLDLDTLEGLSDLVVPVVLDVVLGMVVVLVDKALAVMAGNISNIFHIVLNSVHHQK